VRSIQRRLFFTHLRSMHVTKTSETPSQTEQAKFTTPGKKSAQKSIFALSVFALGLNASAAVYILSPSDFAVPDVSGLVAELLPHQAPSVPTPDTVVATLSDIQSVQRQHVASLQENVSSLQQNTALLQQDSTMLASLRQSVTDEHVDVKKISGQIADEHVDVKKISAQISTLIAKVDSLQNAIAPEITSSIPKGRARNRLSGLMRKRMARQPKAAGAVSLGGAPLSSPATMSTPRG
jgi:cell division protein FtsB